MEACLGAITRLNSPAKDQTIFFYDRMLRTVIPSTSIEAMFSNSEIWILIIDTYVYPILHPLYGRNT